MCNPNKPVGKPSEFDMALLNSYLQDVEPLMQPLRTGRFPMAYKPSTSHPPLWEADFTKFVHGMKLDTAYPSLADFPDINVVMWKIKVKSPMLNVEYCMLASDDKLAQHYFDLCDTLEQSGMSAEYAPRLMCMFDFVVKEN